MKSLVLGLVFVLSIGFVGTASATHGIQQQRQGLFQRILQNRQQVQRLRQQRVQQQKVEKVVVQRVIVDDNRGHHQNYYSQQERVVVPQRRIRFAEVKGLELHQDAYGERIVVREKVIVPKKQVLRVEIDNRHECVIETQRLRGGY